MLHLKIFHGALLSVALSATLAAQAVSFDTQIRDYPVGAYPGAAATGDFNGDGILDVVTSLVSGNGGMSVLLGTGKTTFRAPIVTPGPENAISIVVGDFNNDGKLDVAALVEADSFFVMLGNGDGTFQPAITYPLPFIGSGLATADLNHDGKLDLVSFVFADRGSGSIAVLLGNGDGTFPPATEISVGEITSFVLADFNHDGNIDVAFATGPTINVLPGTGTGSFSPQIVSREQTGEILSMLAADLNGDGNPDLVFNIKDSNPSPALVLPGNGDGTFADVSVLGFQGIVTAIADMNEDGKLDLVGTNSINGNMGVFVAFGNGDLTFNSPATNTPSSLNYGPLVGMFTKQAGAPDVITATTGSSTVSILRNKGDGTFGQPTPLPTPTLARSAVIIDLNHDGERDLVTVDAAGVSIFLGKGDGTFQGAVTYAAGPSPGAVAVGDFNKDGKLDLAVTPGNGTSTVALLLGNGDGTFQPAKAITAGGAVLYGGPVVADFNHDGNLDLVIPSTAFSTLLVLLGRGDGTFQPAKVISIGLTPQFLSTADFNHDGNADLVAGGNGSLSVLLGNGDGTFQVSQTVSSLGGFLYRAAIGDLNGDGKLDLVVPGQIDNLGSSGIYVLLGNGDGTFQPASSILGYVPYAAVLADFNGDGKLDVAMSDSEGNDIPVLLGNGDGTFGPPTRFPGGFSALGLAAGDLNGDNKPDLVIATRLGAIVLFNETK